MAARRLSDVVRIVARHPDRVPRWLLHRLQAAAARARRERPEPASEDSALGYPVVGLAAANPIPAIMAAPEFAAVVAYLQQTSGAARSLLSNEARALLYCLVRNQRPAHVVEIGTFKGGTSEAICRALRGNGHGMLHTVGPFDGADFRPYRRRWPRALAQRVAFHACSSMDFFMRMSKDAIRTDLVLVDGNHDYEFALFDIQCAARAMNAGGFIVVDNVSQVGPYYAVRDFLAAHPAWRECPARQAHFDPTKAFDAERTAIAGTDFRVLRAPHAFVVEAQPRTFGEVVISTPLVTAIRLDIAAPDLAAPDLAAPDRGDAEGAAPVGGTLHVECVLRAFNDTAQIERIGAVSATLDGRPGRIDLVFTPPLALADDYRVYRVEPWLIWRGAQPLLLAAPPVVIGPDHASR